VVREQVEYRRLVHRQAANQLRALNGQPHRDVPSIGIGDDVRRGEIESLEQRPQVIGILVHAPLRVRPLAV
jgi:hypothetical protein